ncbi:proline-rich protein 5 isoform X3 [Dasypus novemcinctus]|uniref:proline-rich protein 5 isoform X3 n=1 Tax=Dasypus novemcinctus TaxID=9361 RepID=UPI00265F43AC|nr:proline-rich protein 5 isoform X3 [Dasypus novemcinctus]
MRTLRRLKFMSSPSLSDLGKREAAAADERGTQQRRACANATWNSIHNGVIAVFQRKGLPDQELFSLNEGVRTEAAGLAGRDLGLLLQRRAAHAPGHLLPRAGQGALGAPAGPAALPEHHHPQREAGGRTGPCPRPRATRHRADAAGATGGARVAGRDGGLPAAGDTRPEGGVPLPGHLRPLLQRGALHTLLPPGEAPPAPRPRGGRPGQEPGGALQELQHAAAEPRGGAGGRGRGGRGRAQALGVGDDVLPRAAGLRRAAGRGALARQTARPRPGRRAGPGPRLPARPQPRGPAGPDPGVGRLRPRGHRH